MWLQMLAHFAKIKQTVNPAQKMVARDMILKTEIVKETALIRRLTTHHRNALPIKNRKDRITPDAKPQVTLSTVSTQ